MMLIWLRSLLFAAGQVVSVVLYTPVSLLAWTLPPLPRARVVSGWAAFVIWWLRVTCGVRHVVEGREHLPDRPSVVLSKHQSAWETIAYQLVFPPQTWVIKRELLRIPFFGWGLAAAGPIAIDRNAGMRALEQIVREGQQHLSAGRWVIVFPEGTRMAPGERGRYNPGGALLAVRAGAPVVPVAHNAGERWSTRGFLKYPGTINVVIGPPIDTAGRRPQDVSSEAERWIEETMERLEASRARR